MLKKQKANDLLKKCDKFIKTFDFLLRIFFLKKYWKIDAAIELNYII